MSEGELCSQMDVPGLEYSRMEEENERRKRRRKKTSVYTEVVERFWREVSHVGVAKTPQPRHR